MRVLGLEPKTYGLKGRCSAKLSYTPGIASENPYTNNFPRIVNCFAVKKRKMPHPSGNSFQKLSSKLL